MIGIELQKHNTDGGAMAILRRGQVPQSLFRAMERNIRLEEEERQQDIAGNDEIDEHSTSLDSELVNCVARNDSIFTFPTPQKLTALLNASDASEIAHPGPKG
ncbi:hypothetical protein BDR22DRAFT_885437 [Usnea florida]